MRPPRSLLVGLFLLLLALPGLQMRFRFVPEVALNGVRVEPGKPPLTPAGWWRGEFQSQAEAWFDDHIGFRGHAVRTDNQIGLSLFRESPSHAADHVVLGHRMMVYTDLHVLAYDGIDAFLEEDLLKAARGLRELQDALAQRGTAFIFLISPSKAAIYPEYLPDGFVRPAALRPATAYERMLPMLRNEGVHVVDGHVILEEEKARSPHALFPPGGVHWNRYSASVVLRRAWQELGRQLGRPLANLRHRAILEDDAPSTRDQEADGANLLNAWHVGHADWRFPRPDLVIDDSGGAFRPKLLVVGDSLWRVPISIIEDLGMVGPRGGFLDYFNRPGGPDQRMGGEAEDGVQGGGGADVRAGEGVGSGFLAWAGRLKFGGRPRGGR